MLWRHVSCQPNIFHFPEEQSSPSSETSRDLSLIQSVVTSNSQQRSPPDHPKCLLLNSSFQRVLKGLLENYLSFHSLPHSSYSTVPHSTQPILWPVRRSSANSKSNWVTLTTHINNTEYLHKKFLASWKLSTLQECCAEGLMSHTCFAKVAIYFNSVFLTWKCEEWLGQGIRTLKPYLPGTTCHHQVISLWRGSERLQKHCCSVPKALRTHAGWKLLLI